VELRGDVYNALNKGTVTSRDGAAGVTARTLQSGPNYLRPASILFPRILQLGVTFTY